MLAIFRLLRRWSQSGQKHQGSPDVAGSLEAWPALLLWPLVVITLHEVFQDISTHTFAHLSTTFAPFAAALLVGNALVFKLAFTLEQEPELLGPFIGLVSRGLPAWVPIPSATSSAQMLFSLMALSVAACLVHGLVFDGTKSSSRTLAQVLMPLLTLLLVAQARLTNIPALLLCLSLQHFLLQSSRQQTCTTRALTNILLSHSTFFAMGGTNGIASIDLSNAYNGVSAYKPAIVGVLLVLTNWAGPLFWALGRKEKVATASVSTTRMQRLAAWSEEAQLLTLWACVEVLAVMAACLIHRQHLFVWTVFSPKFLYMAAWVVCWHIALNVVLAGALAFVG